CFFGGNEADTFASNTESVYSGRLRSCIAWRVLADRFQFFINRRASSQEEKCVVSLLEAAKLAQPLVKCLTLRPHLFLHILIHTDFNIAHFQADAG
ncbi:hypothetical protein JTL70_35325, partial [Pseudomonas aeruginosa]|nr:hypothetical protein [Pseudomonas aeruginosa]